MVKEERINCILELIYLSNSKDAHENWPMRFQFLSKQLIRACAPLVL